jgi:hypothetical protein
MKPDPNPPTLITWRYAEISNPLLEIHLPSRVEVPGGSIHLPTVRIWPGRGVGKLEFPLPFRGEG